MKKLVMLALVCSFSVMVLQGCGNQGNMENNSSVTDQESPDSDGATQKPGENEDNQKGEPNENTNTNLKQDKELFDNLQEIIGKKDRAVTDLFGDGVSEKNDSGEIVNRTYEDISLLQEKVQVSIGYDLGKCYNIVIFLNGDDYQSYREGLEKVLGAEESNLGENAEEGSGAKQTVWEFGARHIMLIESYGTISIMVD